MENGAKNEQFEAARLRTPSPTEPDRAVTRGELAELVRHWVLEHWNKDTAIDATHVGRIENGKIRWPAPYYRAAFRAIFDVESDTDLGFWPYRGTTSPITPTNLEDDGKREGGWEDLPTVTAQESTRHATHAGGAVDGISIEQLQAEAWRLARGYSTMAPLAILVASREARDLTYLLLARTRRPDQTSDLYLVAAQLCGLMAVASFDLGALNASLDQTRATIVYGDLVGDRSVTGWARGHQALIAYWTSDPHAAVKLAYAGLAETPDGPAGARLQCIAARGWAHIGDRARTREALAAGDIAHEKNAGRDFLHDEIGGSFAWGPSRHAACTGSALLRVGEIADAIDQIQLALKLLPTDQQGGLLAERAHCDLATAEILGTNIDAASETLAPVWDVPAARRRHGITGRLLWIERILASRQWNGSRQAADIREQIIMFNAEASARALPADHVLPITPGSIRPGSDPAIPGSE